MDVDFSQRMGFHPLKPQIQLGEINDNLRTAIWNVLTLEYLNGYAPRGGSAYRQVRGSNRHAFAMNYVGGFKRQAIDQIPTNWSEFLAQFRRDFFEGLEWHRVYSLVEFVLASVEEWYKPALLDGFNRAMEREGSGYRVVGGFVTEITSPLEIGAVEEAILKGGKFPGIGEHLSSATRMLGDMQSPDYRNSIKESICAVESLAKQLTGNANATLGSALSELEKHHNLHPALKSAFSSLYGWTSNADGIRHALMDVSNLTHADARLMLICCSAFINFAIDSTKE
ncbi:hypothetical protein D3C81_1149210 [compost metagenome]